MKIAIIAAMEQEIEILRGQLLNSTTQTIAQTEIYCGQLHQHEVILIKSGIGKVAAATSAALLLQQFAVDLVINTGSAGGLADQLNVGDIVISSAVAYHDVDVTAFGYQPGQMAGCPTSFTADAMLQQLAHDAVVQQQLPAVSGLIVSGDAFINGAEQQQRIYQIYPDVIAVEMEAAAIGHVCWLFAKPFVVVRAISDVADKASNISFEEFLPLAAANSSKVVKAMLATLPTT